MNRLAGAAIGIALIAGSAAAQTPPYPPVPPPHVETVPPAPSQRVVWQPGHWHWTGSTYAWIPGRYIARPVHAVHWIEGHWAQHGGGWVWVAGHWG